MTLFLCWVWFPALLLALSAGCGLLLERGAGRRLPGALVPPAGCAVIVVAAQFATATDATAELATPLVVALAVWGYARVIGPFGDGSLRERLRGLERWGMAAALGVFLVFGAPVLLSGEPTFAGYIKLDDTGTWFAMVDRVMEHGRNLDGLPLSTYQATLDFNLASGYPVGPFLPLGVAQALSGQDVPWVFQPYLSFLAAMLALILWVLARPVLRSQPLRATVVFVGAQSALLFGYAMWGGIKELVAVVIIGLIAALLADFLRGPKHWRQTMPLGIAVAAAMSTLTPGGAVIWIIPLAVLAALLARRLGGPALRLRPWVWVATVASALTLPWLFGAGLLPPTARPLTSHAARGNLLEPLHPFQLMGVWPAGDFRTDPGSLPLTFILIALVAFAAVVGILRAGERRALGVLLFSVGATVGAVVISWIGSPWVGAKALAIGSPALLFAALIGCGSLLERGSRGAAVPIGGAIAIGVLWSNVLAYHDANLAPRDRLVELGTVGERIAGQGPTLMTEYEPYGPRHFLRDAVPEGASEFGGLDAPLRKGGKVAVGHWADIDDLDLDGLLRYRTLVIRKSPAASRPPAVYDRISSGEHWDVWQRPAEPEFRVTEHIPLGNPLYPNGKASCESVKRLNGAEMLAAAKGPEPILAPLVRGPGSEDWPVGPLLRVGPPVVPPVPGQLDPSDSGTAGAGVRVKNPGRYVVSLGGSVRGRVELKMDGQLVGTTRQEISYPGHYFALGEISLEGGDHKATIEYGQDELSPGTGWRGPYIGPLVLSPASAEADLTYLPGSRARSLCGKRLDWIEALSR